VRIDRVSVGPLETNCWIVSDDAGGPVVVIDPGDDLPAIEQAIGGREVATVVLTHGHFDHLGAAGELSVSFDAPLAVHEADAAGITTAEGTGGAFFGFHGHVAPEPDHRLADGDVVAAGLLRLRVLHTPGHSPGSISLLAEGEGHVFSGDTVFAGSVGRTDFPGGDARALKASITSVLAALPAETKVHPGHGPDTTIGREQRVNPFFPRA